MKKKKRGLDLRSPNTVASPSSIMAFNTFLYTPELHINIHPYTTTAPASSSDFNSHFTSHGHLLPHWVHLILPLNHLFDNFSTRVQVSHASQYDKSAPVWVFWWSCQPLYCSLFRCGNLIFGVPLRRGNGHKGGEVKVQSPRLGGLWWSAWELEKGKLWLEYEWNHRRGGEERERRGERRKADYGWITHHTMDSKGGLSLSVRRRGHQCCYSPTHTPCSHLGACEGQSGSNIT